LTPTPAATEETASVSADQHVETKKNAPAQGELGRDVDHAERLDRLLEEGDRLDDRPTDDRGDAHRHPVRGEDLLGRDGQERLAQVDARDARAEPLRVPTGGQDPAEDAVAVLDADVTGRHGEGEQGHGAPP
jgi:hypothetical protein